MQYSATGNYNLWPLDNTMKLHKKYKGLIAHTYARTHTNPFSNDYFYPSSDASIWDS